ncbi:MAG: helix-turn-helix domain-containing protein [Velocimicrobium sp.]
MEQNNKEASLEIITQEDLMKLLRIKRTTLYKILKADFLPLVKIGQNYYTTPKLMNEWFERNKGADIYF